MDHGTFSGDAEVDTKVPFKSSRLGYLKPSLLSSFSNYHPTRAHAFFICEDSP